jgi:Sulfotransferase family
VAGIARAVRHQDGCAGACDAARPRSQAKRDANKKVALPEICDSLKPEPSSTRCISKGEDVNAKAACTVLDSDALQQLARERLASFGQEVNFCFLDGLAELSRSLDAEAELSPRGRQWWHDVLVERLIIQGRLQQQTARHPEILRLRVPPVLFVLGLPRTGTTLLHNLLAQHSQLRAPALWELTYPVDPDGGQAARGEQRLRAAVARQMKRRERIMPQAMAAHYMHADRPDECRILMQHSFRSVVDAVGNKVTGYERWLMNCDMIEPYRYHRQQLQNILWRVPAERLVLKDIYHLWFLPALLRVYPKARFIIIHRNPLELVPSAASLSALCRPASSESIDYAEEGRRWLSRLAQGAGRMMAARTGIAPDYILDIRYPRLLADPLGLIAEIAEFAGITMAPLDRTRMSRYLKANPQHHRGRHHYSLSQFSLSASEVNREFAAYRAAYGI